MATKYSLAISTINNSVSACIFSDMQLINQIQDPKKDNRNVSKLFKVVDDLLEKSQISYNDIAEIYISVGPGSFTAIRIGLAYALGLNIAKDIKVYGVSNLQLMAYLIAQEKESGVGQAYFLLDAQRDQIFMQALDISNFKELSECELVDYNVLQMPLSLPLVIDSEIYEQLQAVPNYSNLVFKIINYNAATAVDIGNCGFLLKAFNQTKPLIPFYVRLPDAKPNII